MKIYCYLEELTLLLFVNGNTSPSYLQYTRFRLSFMIQKIKIWDYVKELLITVIYFSSNSYFIFIFETTTVKGIFIEHFFWSADMRCVCFVSNVLFCIWNILKRHLTFKLVTTCVSGFQPHSYHTTSITERIIMCVDLRACFIALRVYLLWCFYLRQTINLNVFLADIVDNMASTHR